MIVTVGVPPLAKLFTVPTVNAGVTPSAPLTNPKFNIGFVVVPVIVTVGVPPLAKLFTVPTVNAGVTPLVPLAPLSNPKFNILFVAVDAASTVTVGAVPFAKSVTVPIVKFAICPPVERVVFISLNCCCTLPVKLFKYNMF